MSVSSFVWYELVTNDVDAALAFYGKVVGWDGSEFSGGDGRYVIVSAKGKGVGGVMPLPPAMPQPFWLSYIGVSDLDAAIAKLEGAGGALYRAFEIPTVGRIAMVADPQGVGFAMIQGASDQSSEAFKENTPGHGNWNELHATDWQAAWKFYSGQFGWVKDAAMDMGPMGVYQLMTANGVQIGAMFNSPNVPRPHWLPYFGVDGIDAAHRRVVDGGGSVLHGPSEVPGGRFIIQAQDPQGAMFALVGPR